MNKNKRSIAKPPANVVQALFSAGIPLCEYIPSHLILPGDSPKYLNFCKTTYVIPASQDKEKQHKAGLLAELSAASDRRDATSSGGVSFKDILQGFIADIIRKYPNGFQLKHEQNVLALGYRSKRHNSELGMRNNADIECFAVNTVHLMFAGECWKTAALRLGEPIIRHLLGCAMFVLTANGSYVQVSGVASSEMLGSAYLAQANPYSLNPTAAGPNPVGAAESSTGCDHTASQLRSLLKELSARLIPRYMIFYGDDRHTCNIASKTRPGASHGSSIAAASTRVAACASPDVSPRAIRGYYYLQPNSTITETSYPLLFKAGSTQYGTRRTYYDYIFIHPLLSQGKPALALDLYRQIFLASAAQFPQALAGLLAVSGAGQAAAACSGASASSVDQSRLLALCKGIIEGYRSCNISLLLSLFCKQPAVAAAATLPVATKRWGGRGKRGGRHVRQRVLFRNYLAGGSSQLQESSCISADAQNPLVWDGCTAGVADKDGNSSADEAMVVDGDGADTIGLFLPQPAVPAFDFYALLDSITASEGSFLGASAFHAGDSVILDTTIKNAPPPPPVSNRKRKRHSPVSGVGGTAASSDAACGTAPLTTIGERLYSRVRRCSRRDRRCSAAGYATQDEDENGSVDSGAATDELEAALARTDGGCGELAVDRHIAEYFTSASYRQLLAPLSCRLPAPVTNPITMAAADAGPEVVNSGRLCAVEEHSDDAFADSSVHKRSRSLPVASSAHDATYHVAQRSISTGGVSVVGSAMLDGLEADNGFHFKMECAHVAAAAATPSSSIDYLSGNSNTGGGNSSFRLTGIRSQGSQNTPLHGMFSDSWLQKHAALGDSLDRLTQESGECPCGLTPGKPPSVQCVPPVAPTVHGMACSLESVCQFTTAVCRRVLPLKNVWGSARNQNRFLRFIAEYIRLGRYENCGVRQLLEGLKMNDIPWLVRRKASSKRTGEGDGDANINPAVTAAGAERLHQVNSVLLAVFLQWVFTSVVNPLLSTTFYITEGEGLGASVLYYLKSVWTAIIAEVGVKLIRHHFMEISVPTAAEAARTAADLALSASKISGRSVTFPVGARGVAASTVVGGSSSAGATSTTRASAGLRGPINALCDATSDSLPFIRFVPKKNTIRPIVNMKYNSGVRTKPASGVASAAAKSTGGVTKALSSGSGGTAAARPKPPSHFVAGVNTWGTVGGGTVMTNGALYQALHLLRHLVDNSGKNYFLPGSHSHRPRLGHHAAAAMAQCTAAAGFSSIKGFGCLGMDEAYVKFKQFKQHVLRNFMENRAGASGAAGVGTAPAPRAAGDDAKSSVNYPKFYVAALDLEKCYDNIDTTRLYAIVKEMNNGEVGGGDGCDESLLLLKYTVSQYIESMERPITKRLRFVVNEGDTAPFPSVAKALAHKYHNSIVTDGVIYPTLSVEELRRLIKHHLFNHVVQLPKFPVDTRSGAETSAASAAEEPSAAGDVEADTPAGAASGHRLGKGGVFTQVKGIPQGSILSPLLCKVYYDFVETRVFGHSSELELLGLLPAVATGRGGMGKTCIIRMVDDYLIVSIDQGCVQHFLQKVHTAYAPYGGGVNPLKTRVNFDSVIEVNGEKVKLQNICDDTASLVPQTVTGTGGRLGTTPDRWLSWCGYYINTRTLEVAPNFSRILDLPIQHSVTVEYHKSIGLSLRKAMKTYVKAKCHGILLDSTINSLPTVEGNVYEIFRVAALRTACYIKKLLVGPAATALNSQYIVHCILEAVLYGARLLHTRTVRTVEGPEESSGGGDYDEPAMSRLDALIAEAENASTMPPQSTRGSRGQGRGARRTGADDLNSRGICLISVNDAIHLGMRAFVDVFEKVQTNGLFSSIIKILAARMKNRNGQVGR